MLVSPANAVKQSGAIIRSYVSLVSAVMELIKIPTARTKTAVSARNFDVKIVLNM